jgi:hypothetical protein
LKPIAVSIDVGRPVEEVFAFLDVLANHESITDHMLVEWSYSGPARGVGARARMRTTGFGPSQWLDMEVVSAAAPVTIAEESTTAGGRRRTRGTYTLRDLGGGRTRVRFELAFVDSAPGDWIARPLLRPLLRRANARALKRLRETLVPDGGPGADLASRGASSERRGVLLTKIAGWTAVALGAVHVVVAPLDVRDTWSQVLDDGWWNTFTLDKATTVAQLERSETFWLTLGSFGVPVFMLGCYVVWSTRQHYRVPEGIGWIMLAWGLLSGTALPASPAWALAVIGGLLVVGDKLRTRAAALPNRLKALSNAKAA